MTGIDRESLATELQALVQQIRAHVPDAVINTRLAHADQSGIVIHAQIVGTNSVSGGAHATATGELAAELAENRALARAMIAIGIPPVPEPVAPTQLHTVPASDSSRVVPFRTPESEPEPVPPAADSPSTPPGPVTPDDPEPEDFSWTAFWTWARANGFANREALEEAIGQPIKDLMPGEIRRLAQPVIDNR